MLARAVRTGGYAGLLLWVPALVAWLSGLPFVFPSPGPSAYLVATAPGPQATVPGSEAVTPRRVIGGHLVGVAAGLLSYHTLAPGLAFTAPVPTFSGAQFWPAASAVASVALTGAGMRVTRTEHPPARATTLIVSSGLLSSLGEVGVVVAVLLLGLTHRELHRRLRRTPA